MNKIDTIIEDLELYLISHIGGTIDDKKSKLPLTSEKEIYAIIWNLLTVDSFRSRISYSDYELVIKKLLNRIKHG